MFDPNALKRLVHDTARAVLLPALLLAAPALMAQPGTVQSHQKISDTAGGFTGTLDDQDRFGGSVAGVGDLDGDGTQDIAVGANQDADGGTERGAVWVLFLNTDGTVKSHQKISSTEGGFTGTLDDLDRFGWSVAGVGDLDGDGTEDIVVGALQDDDGGMDRGAVWVLFLNADGTVKSHQKISSTEGGFTGTLDDFDNFGASVAGVGDLDGDGTEDIAVGAYLEDDGGSGRGAVWVLFLNTDGTVDSHQKISDTEGGFTGTLDDFDRFGASVAGLGDLDGDGTEDIAVGAYLDDDGGTDRGAVWVLFLNADGTVKSHQKISSTEGGFTGTLDDDDNFGASVAGVGDLDGDGTEDIAIGASRDDDEGTNRGAVWVLFLNTDGTVKSHQKISDTEGGFTGTLNDIDNFGASVAGLGDLDGDGIQDIAVGAVFDDDGGANRGAVWMLFLENAGNCVFRMRLPNQKVDVDTPLEFRVRLEHNRPVTVTRAIFMEILDESGTVLFRRQTRQYTFNYLDVVDRKFSVNLPPRIVPGDYALALGLSGMTQGRVKATRAFTVVADGARQAAPALSVVEVPESEVSLPGAVQYLAGAWTEVVAQGELPSDYALMQNYPNPFNPSTEIGFTLPESANVRLAVYDVLGRQVQLLLDGTMEAGTHEVSFDASGLPSGTYLYRLETPQGSMVRTMLLAK